MIGTNTHVIIALNIKIPDISEEIVCNCSAIFADAITNDNVDVNKNADAIVVLLSNQRLMKKTGINFEIIKAKINTGIISNNDGSLIKEGMFKSTPTIIKNIGIKKP